MARSTPAWDALRSDIAGEVVVPGSPGYAAARRPAIARYGHIRPQAVVRCATPEDVATTFRFAHRAGLPVAPRGGGHCFAGRSSTTGIVLDVTPMSETTLSAGELTVGAGARLGAVYDALTPHGRTIPAGCGPTVGVAGHLLGGGLGILGRTYGLTSDHLLAARVVLADGRVVDCDERRDPELFWALRGGGGGNFGVLTSLRLRTVPAPEMTCFHLVWPHTRAATAIREWQAWAIDGPDELAASLLITASADPAESPVVHLFGTMLGAGADRLLGEFVARVGTDPESADRVPLSFRDAKRYLVAHGPGDDRPDGHLYSKSEFFARSLPEDVIEKLVAELLAGRTAGESRALEFLPMGGAYQRIHQDATAFPHRDARFLLKHTTLVDPDAPDSRLRATRDWLDGSWGLVHGWGTGGVYPGFPDPDLANWAAAYHGRNYDRLVRVKARYDPGGFFHFHQSIPPGHGGLPR